MVVLSRPARFEVVCSSVTLENPVALLCVVVSQIVTVLVGSDVGNVIFVGLVIVHPPAHGKCMYVMYGVLIEKTPHIRPPTKSLYQLNSTNTPRDLTQK